MLAATRTQPDLAGAEFFEIKVAENPLLRCAVIAGTCA